jgi:hypothetical protein
MAPDAVLQNNEFFRPMTNGLMDRSPPVGEWMHWERI